MVSDRGVAIVWSLLLVLTEQHSAQTRTTQCCRFDDGNSAEGRVWFTRASGLEQPERIGNIRLPNRRQESRKTLLEWGGTWISLILVLLSMFFFMTGKAVGRLDFVHSPPNLPSGQRAHPLRQPSSYHGIKSGASCPVILPSRCYTTLHPSGRDSVPALPTRPFHWASWRGPQHLVLL